MPISRRKFLASSLGAIALGVLPLPRTSSDHLGIGVIGVGQQGRKLLRAVLAAQATHHIALRGVADRSRETLERAVGDGLGVPTRTDYRTLLAQPDIDAVIIATPDESHAPIALDALRAGKDVLVELPMTLTVDEADTLRRVVKSTDRILQVGHHDYSGYESALQVGTVRRIDIAIHLPEIAVPADSAYERSIGVAAQALARYIAIAHRMMNVQYPISVVAHGSNYRQPGRRDNPDTFQALFDYAEGFMLSVSVSLGIQAEDTFVVRGTDGTQAIPLSTAGIDQSLVIWLDCIRRRETPPASVDVGYQHMVALTLAADAYWTGQRQFFRGA